MTTNGVTTPQEAFGFNYMVHAVGFGVRYRTPIGPVRLDLAFSPNSTHFEGCAGLYRNAIAAVRTLLQSGRLAGARAQERPDPARSNFISLPIGQAF